MTLNPPMATLAGNIERFRPIEPALLRDPYPTYAYYREHDPVHWGHSSMSTLDGSWYLFAYEQNAAMLTDAATFASDPATVGADELVPEAFRPITHIYQRWLGGMDPPDHHRLRVIMARAFTQRRVAAMQPRIEAITAACLNEALSRGDGVLDVLADVSFPLPMSVVGDALGVKPGDWKLFQNWATDITHAIDMAGDSTAGKQGSAAIQGMFDYFAERVAERRRAPGDDLLSAMVAAADDAGEPMQDFDAIAIATELGFAGQETTANSVAKAVLGLMDQRDRWLELAGANEPLWDSAVDELLRWTCPVQRQRWRWATVDTRLGEREIQRGESVVSLLASANRDPAYYPDPDRIDFQRQNERHLTFGSGTHYCIGSALARMELKVALRQLVQHLPQMKLVESPDEIEWHNNYALPGPKRVLVSG